MTTLTIGSPAPAFSVPDDSEKITTLADFHGKKLVIYFYPKDDTPGCTTESCGFRDQFPAFLKLKAAIVGVSKDSLKSHVKFKEKFGLNFPLLSDEGGTMCEDYGVWVEKSMYGKKYMGIERTTFLIDEKGLIEKIWSKVKVDGHVDEVRAAIKN